MNAGEDTLEGGQSEEQKVQSIHLSDGFYFCNDLVYEVVSSLQKKRDIGDLKVLGTNEKGALENSRETHKVRQISGSHWQPGAG